jgi:hypothetical protein
MGGRVINVCYERKEEQKKEGEKVTHFPYGKY